MSAVRSVDLNRAPGGFGFTLSSQGPCVLSCILASSPAHKAGLRPGDQILYVNGSSVEKAQHEQVVKLIARSPNGTVSLGVRNRAVCTNNLTAAKPESHDPIEEETVNENILNRVDKVVEELKSGLLIVNKQTSLRHSSNEQVIDEDEIVSDEELKASFTETLRSESSSDSVFIEQNHIDNRRASEGDGLPGLRLLYPALTPVKHDKNINCDQLDSEPDLRAIVGYLGSIELPGNSSLQAASLNAIRSCVRRLRAQQKVHVIFLLEVSAVGIHLIDNHGKSIVTYPVKSLTFTGICSDDKRVFGLVTRKANDANRPNSWHSSNDKMDMSSDTVNCSCHVFTVDPEISKHDNHHSVAEKFHINCTPVNGKCKEFLDSSSPILQAIDELFKERMDSQSSGEKSAFLQSLPSIQSENNDNVVNNRHLGSTNTESNDHTVDVQDTKSNQLDYHVQEQNVIRKESLVNECVMETPKHRIHVRVTDCPESSYISHRSSVEEEPFRHRVVQIERVSSLPPRRNREKPLTPNQICKEKDQITVSDMKGNHDIHLGNDGKEGDLSQIHQTEPSACDPDESAPNTSTNDNAGSKHDLKELKSHFSVNSKMRLSHSAENLTHNEYESVVSSNSNLNLSPSVCSSTQSVHSLSSMPGDISSIDDGRVTRWALGFDKLMQDSIGLRCFQEFLKKEFSEENIVFWMACADFRNITAEKELKSAAVSIFDAHLSSHATMPVNIDSSAIKRAEEHLANPTNDMYRLQQQQVYTLMKFDSYPRFLKSDLYRQCLVADMERQPLPFDEEKPDKGKLFKKGNCLSISSEESECSSVSSRGSYTFEIKRSTRGWGRRSSKKSTSSYDETKTPGEKKKSFLPWKGKQPKKPVNRPFDSQPSSTRSSLSSLSDSFPSMSYSTESLEGRRESEVFQFCRVILPDHSSTIMTAKQGQTLRQALTQLYERRHMSFVAADVFISGSERPLQTKELDADMSSMAGKEINLEHRSLFKVELPKGILLLVKARPDQSINDSIEPILRRYDMEYSNVIVHLVDCEVPLDSGIPVASIEHQCVVIETSEQLTGNNNGPPKINIKPPVGFSSPRRSSRRGSSFDDSIFEDIIRGKKQSLGNGYFDDAGVWVPGLKPFRSQESLNDDSFGKSFLRGPGLFSRKRKESSEKSLNKSGRGNIKSKSEVTELLDLLSRAQGNRMDDQRGELGKHSFVLPDFLRLPQAAPPIEIETSPPPPPPPPPPPVVSPSRYSTGSLKLKGETRPVVKKALSTPSSTHEQVDLMSELVDKLRRRSVSGTSTIPECHESEDSGSLKRSASSSSNERSHSPWEHRGEQYRRINIVRPRTCTDGAVFTVEAVTPVRLDSRPLSLSRHPISLSESMPDTLQTRTHSTQPLTVNSIRGLPTSTGNINNSIDEQDEPDKNVRVVQAVSVHKYNTYSAKQRTLSSSSAPDYTRNVPYVYEATPHEERRTSKTSIKRRQSDGIATNTATSTKGNLSPFHFPQLNTRKTEVFVPSTPGIKPYRIISSESKPRRPKPITDSVELMQGLVEDSHIIADQPPAVTTPPTTSPRIPTSSVRNITSPLPLPPSPVPDHVQDLDIANFPPPSPLCEGVSTPLATPNLDLSINKTITPGTNEKTFVAEPTNEGTPYGPHKESRRDNQKLGSRLFDEPRTSSSRKPGKEIPQLDPYVTYESDDMRITFV